MATQPPTGEARGKYEFDILPSPLGSPLSIDKKAEAEVKLRAKIAVATALDSASTNQSTPHGVGDRARIMHPENDKIANIAKEAKLISDKINQINQRLKEINQRAFKEISEDHTLSITTARRELGNKIQILHLDLQNLEKQYKALEENEKRCVDINQVAIEKLKLEYKDIVKHHVVADRLLKILDQALNLSTEDVRAVPLYAGIFRQLHALQQLHKQLIEEGATEKAEKIKNIVDAVKAKIEHNLPNIIKHNLIGATPPADDSNYFNILVKNHPQRVADLLDCYDFLMLNGLMDDTLKQVRNQLNNQIESSNDKQSINFKRDPELYRYGIITRLDKLTTNELEQLRDAEDAKLRPNRELRKKIEEILKSREHTPRINTERDKLFQVANDIANQTPTLINQHPLKEYLTLINRLGELAYKKGDAVAAKQLVKLVYALELKGNDKIREGIIKNKEAHAVLVKVFQNTPLIASMMANGELPTPSTPGEFSRVSLFYKKVIVDLGMQAINDKNDVRAEQAFNLLNELRLNKQLHILKMTPEAKVAIRGIVEWKQKQLKAQYDLGKNIKNEAIEFEKLIHKVASDLWPIQMSEQMKFNLLQLDIFKLRPEFGKSSPKNVNLSNNEAEARPKKATEDEFIIALGLQKKLEQLIHDLSNSNDQNVENILKEAINQKQELDIRIQQHQQIYFRHLNANEILEKIESIKSKIGKLKDLIGSPQRNDKELTERLVFLKADLLEINYHLPIIVKEFENQIKNILLDAFAQKLKNLVQPVPTPNTPLGLKDYEEAIIKHFKLILPVIEVDRKDAFALTSNTLEILNEIFLQNPAIYRILMKNPAIQEDLSIFRKIAEENRDRDVKEAAIVFKRNEALIRLELSHSRREFNRNILNLDQLQLQMIKTNIDQRNNEPYYQLITELLKPPKVTLRNYIELRWINYAGKLKELAQAQDFEKRKDEIHVKFEQLKKLDLIKFNSLEPNISKNDLLIYLLIAHENLIKENSGKAYQLFKLIEDRYEKTAA